jgi:hypothetical protein
MKSQLNFIYKKSFSIFLFVVFLVFNFYYFLNNFFLTFLNEGSNADEYYENNLYSISNVSFEKIFYTSSQLYIFVCSCFNYFINSPKISTRIVSLIACLLLLAYFVKRINLSESSFLEKIYKSTMFTCAIFITNQMFIGTSDLLAFSLIIPPFLIIIESVEFKDSNLSIKQSILVGALFALAIATRPTSLLLIISFYATFFLMAGVKSIFSKKNAILLVACLFTLFIINFLPIIENNKIILDVKEVPKETGVNWFQRNYLMAKYWDSNKIPHTQWISTQEVIDFKKSNPNFIFPKNQIDLIFKEPGLYFRQMLRMFIKALYSSYRFMYLLFPLLFSSFISVKSCKLISIINSRNEKHVFQNKLVVGFYLISILMFSFIAIKLFEFRWIIPILFLYTFFSIKYLSIFPHKVRFLIYNLSFVSGIIMYILFFIKAN